MCFPQSYKGASDCGIWGLATSWYIAETGCLAFSVNLASHWSILWSASVLGSSCCFQLQTVMCVRRLDTSWMACFMVGVHRSQSSNNGSIQCPSEVTVLIVYSRTSMALEWLQWEELWIEVFVLGRQPAKPYVLWGYKNVKIYIAQIHWHEQFHLEALANAREGFLGTSSKLQSDGNHHSSFNFVCFLKNTLAYPSSYLGRYH